jgi:hypothetical protein
MLRTYSVSAFRHPPSACSAGRDRSAPRRAARGIGGDRHEPPPANGGESPFRRRRWNRSGTRSGGHGSFVAIGVVLIFRNDVAWIATPKIEVIDSADVVILVRIQRENLIRREPAALRLDAGGVQKISLS